MTVYDKVLGGQMAMVVDLFDQSLTILALVRVPLPTWSVTLSRHLSSAGEHRTMLSISIYDSYCTKQANYHITNHVF